MPKLEHILAQHPAWELGEPILIKQFTQGLNHQTVLLKFPEKYAVLKYFSQPNPFAIKMQYWAAQQQLSPKALYSDIEYHYQLTDYFPNTLPNTLLSNKVTNNNLKQLAKRLQQYHKTPPNKLLLRKGEFNLIAYCEHYLEQIPRNTSLLKEYQQALTQLHAFAQLPEKKVPCHNDLVKQNCLFSQNDMQLIDWEYAQLNNPWFDLASVIFYFKLTAQQQNLFLNHYKTQTTLDMSPLKLALTSVQWLDKLWRLAKQSG